MPFHSGAIREMQQLIRKGIVQSNSTRRPTRVVASHVALRDPDSSDPSPRQIPIVWLDNLPAAEQASQNTVIADPEVVS